MQDSTRSSAADRERASVQGSNVAATGRSRRRWSAEEKARVVRESLRPGERVGEVARRYGISRWQLSTWRSLARQGKLAVASSAEAVGVEPQPQPAFAALEVDSATGPSPMGVGCDRVARGDGAPRWRYRRFAGRGDCLGVAGASMNVAVTGMRVVVATRPVDFRKGHDGLAAVVEHELGLDPYCGVVFVFRPKRVDRIKVLYWDGTGLVLASKRLEQGRFAWPAVRDGVMRLSRAQFEALFEGLDWRRVWGPRVRRPLAAA